MIELIEARKLLKRAVETQGREFVYVPQNKGKGPDEWFASCLYRPAPRSAVSDSNDPRRKTGCLIGVALSLHGETEHLLFDGTVAELSRGYPTMMSKETTEYFTVAQNEQDAGESWGEAYDAAEASLG